MLSIAVFHILPTLCAGLAQKVKLSRDSTQHEVSPNLAFKLLGKQYSFELEGSYSRSTRLLKYRIFYGDGHSLC